MRTLTLLVVLVISQAAFAQDSYDFSTGPQIAAGAARSFADLQEKLEASEAEVAVLRQENSQLLAKIKRMEAAQRPTPAIKPYSSFIDCKITVECLVDKEGNSICPGCEGWWKGPEPKDLEAKRWDVYKTDIDEPIPNKLYPRWRICIGEECGFIEYTPHFKVALQKYLDDRQRKLQPQSFRLMKVGLR